MTLFHEKKIKETLKILSDCLIFAEETFGLDFFENPDFNTIGTDKNTSEKISSNSPRIVKIYKKAKKDLAKNATSKELHRLNLAETTPEFVQLISTLKYGEIEIEFFEELVHLIKSKEYKDYNSARHELSVYQKYKRSKLNIHKLHEGEIKTPDFIVYLENNDLFIECKSIISEVIKLTPRLSSFRDKILAKLKRNNCSSLINVVLDSSRPTDYESEVEDLIDKAINLQQNTILSGENSKIQFSKLEVNKVGDEYSVMIPAESNNVGGIEMEFVEKSILAYGINFMPYFPNDYKSALSKHLSKANEQIETNGEGIIHIQFPELSVLDFIKVIASHGHRVQDYLISHNLLAVVLEFQYLKKNIEGVNHVFPNIETVYFNPELSNYISTKEKPYWLNNYLVVELTDESRGLVLEFEMNSESKSFILYLSNPMFDINIKVYIIQDNILMESIIFNKTVVVMGEIQHGLLKENNKLAFNTGEYESVYINGEKVLLN